MYSNKLELCSSSECLYLVDLTIYVYSQVTVTNRLHDSGGRGTKVAMELILNILNSRQLPLKVWSQLAIDKIDTVTVSSFVTNRKVFLLFYRSKLVWC